MKTIDLSGGLVLVTGGAGGIGRAIAIDAAAAGAAVAVCDSDRQVAETVAATIRSQEGVALAFPIDVRNRDDIVATTEQAVEPLGCLRGVVTAAGILHTGPLAQQNSSLRDAFMPVAQRPVSGIACFFADLV